MENPYHYTEGEGEFPKPNLAYPRYMYVFFGVMWACVWVLELLFCLTLLQETYALCRLVCGLLVLHGVVMMFLAFRSAAIGEE